MKYKSRAYLLACEQANDAKVMELERLCTSLRASNEALKFDCQVMQSELTALRAAQHQATVDTKTVTFNALSTRCQRLNAIGVPATIHRGHVLHSRTRAIINPGQYGVGT